jgi:hypothetical protein
MRLLVLIALLMTAAMIALAIWIGSSSSGGHRKRLPRLRESAPPPSLVAPVTG